jgi:hypothetical protein
MDTSVKIKDEEKKCAIAIAMIHSVLSDLSKREVKDVLSQVAIRHNYTLHSAFASANVGTPSAKAEISANQQKREQSSKRPAKVITKAESSSNSAIAKKGEAASSPIPEAKSPEATKPPKKVTLPKNLWKKDDLWVQAQAKRQEIVDRVKGLEDEKKEPVITELRQYENSVLKPLRTSLEEKYAGELKLH